MIKNGNTAWRHRAAATVILMLVIGLVVTQLILPAFQKRSENRETVKELHNTINHYYKLVSEKERLKRRIESMRSVSKAQDGFLSTKVPSLAAADMQRQIISMVEDLDGQIISTQTENKSVDDIYERVSLNVRIKIVLSGLQDLLYRIESNAPYLFVDEIRINKDRRSAFDQTTDNDLNIYLKISGYMQQPT